jgi:hypothetical protein
MRKTLLGLGTVSALVLGFTLLTPSAPAYAATGCSCVSLNKAPVCVSDFTVCNFKVGGVCAGFCDLPEKKMRKRKKKK